MTDIPEMAGVPLHRVVGEAAGATLAVREGIATHAQKEEQRRDQARRDMDANKALSAATVVTPG
jgi:hypothetical protein